MSRLSERWTSRTWGVDSEGNEILLRTVVHEGHKRVEVIDHVSGEVYRDFERKVNERVHQAFEDLARRNPAALLAVAEEQEKAREQAKHKAESA